MGDQTDESSDQLMKELEEVGRKLDLDNKRTEESRPSMDLDALPALTPEEASMSQADPPGPDRAADSQPAEAEAEDELPKKALPAATKKRGLNMVKKASTPEPASMAAEKPAGKPAAGISTTKPANKKRIAARVVKATKEDVPPEPVITPEQVPDQKTPETPSKVAARKASAKETAKTEAAAEGDAHKVKRARNAFMYFSTDMRTSVKAGHPNLSMGEMSKKLGEMWKAASGEEKAKYEAMAEKDKDRAAAERTKLKAAAKTNKRPRAKTAYQLFCDKERTQLKEANPEAKFGELNALLAAKWKEVSDADKKVFQTMHEELKAQLLGDQEAHKPKQKRKAAPKAGGDADKTGMEEANNEEEEDRDDEANQPPLKKAAKASHEDTGRPTEQSAQDTEDPAQAATGSAADDEGSLVAEMMKVDWKANPAEYIVAETSDAMYVVKRKGLDFTCCGMVDAQAAKRLRLPSPKQDAQAYSPVSVAMIDEWEAFKKGFRCAVQAHTDCGDLDLDDLNKGSPLEMCSFLGTLRKPDFPLHKTPKNDISIKVPMLELSKAVQRVIDVERNANKDLRKELATLKAAAAAKVAAQPTREVAKHSIAAEAGDSEE